MIGLHTKYGFILLYTAIIFLFGSVPLYSQTDTSSPALDSIRISSGPEVENSDSDEELPDSLQVHSITKATWFSAVLPGLGQAYNRKYWKIPIIYAALGGLTYLIIDNNYYYHYYLDGFYEINSTPENDLFLGLYDERQLIELQNIYRKWRDLSIIITGVVYALNILDAHVDAHLFYYNLDDDLTLRWEPALIRGPSVNTNAIGVSFKVNF